MNWGDRDVADKDSANKKGRRMPAFVLWILSARLVRQNNFVYHVDHAVTGDDVGGGNHGVVDHDAGGGVDRQCATLDSCRPRRSCRQCQTT